MGAGGENALAGDEADEEKRSESIKKCLEPQVSLGFYYVIESWIVCHICTQCPWLCKTAIHMWHNPHSAGPHLFRLSVHDLMLVSTCVNAVTGVQQPPVKSLAPDVYVSVLVWLSAKPAAGPAVKPMKL